MSASRRGSRARLQLSGGWNAGNSVSLPSGTGVLSNRANRCFVVDSPQELFHPQNATNTAASNGCETVNPYQHRIKVNGSYPLPGNFQVAFVYQSLPGAPYAALYTVTTAQILPSLGRNLAGGVRTVTVDLLPPYSAYVDQRTNQVDLRLSKIARVRKIRFQANFDLYNMLNSSTVVAVNQAYTAATWLQPTQLIPGRLFKFGVQLDF